MISKRVGHRLGVACLALGGIIEGCGAAPTGGRREVKSGGEAHDAEGPTQVASARPPKPVDAASSVAPWHWSLPTLPVNGVLEAPKLLFSRNDEQLLVHWSQDLVFKVDDGTFLADNGCEVEPPPGEHAECVGEKEAALWQPEQIMTDDLTALLRTEVVEVKTRSGEYGEGYQTTLEVTFGKVERRRTFRSNQNFIGVYSFAPASGPVPPWLVLLGAYDEKALLVDFSLRGERTIATKVMHVTPLRDARLALELDDGLEIWAMRGKTPARTASYAWKGRYGITASHAGDRVAFLPFPPPTQGDIPVYVQALDGNTPPRVLTNLPGPRGPVAQGRWEAVPDGPSGTRRARFLGVEADVKKVDESASKRTAQTAQTARAQGMCCNLLLQPACPREWLDPTSAYCFNDTTPPAFAPGAEPRLRCTQLGDGEKGTTAPWPFCQNP
jgi:hypothetical protein